MSGKADVTVLGRVTQEPICGISKNKTPYAFFTIAVNRYENGHKYTDFIDHAAYRGKAEFVKKYFHIGDLFLIESSLRNSKYTDKDGVERRNNSIVVDKITPVFPLKSKEAESTAPDLPEKEYTVPEGVNPETGEYTPPEDGLEPPDYTDYLDIPEEPDEPSHENDFE